MNINSFILKLVGKAELPQDIEAGNNYHISLEGSIPEFKFQDNEDGSWNKIFTFRPIKVELLDPKGKTLKLKDPRSNSVKFRNYCFKVWNGHEAILYDFDTIYDEVVLVAMTEMPDLMDKALKRLKERE